MNPVPIPNDRGASRRGGFPAALGVRTAALLAALAALGGSALPAPAARAAELDKLAPELRTLVSRAEKGDKKAKEATVRVLVRADALESSAITGRLRGKVKRLRRALLRVGVADLDVTAAQLAALTADPAVRSISPDRPVRRATLDINPAAVGADVAGQQLSGPAALAFNAPDGAGVGVAVIDSGIAPVGDLSGRIAGFKDLVNNGPDGAAYDDNGHGTHVAGVIAGSGAASSGADATRTFRGIAPGAHLVGVKALGADGSGTTATVIAALDWCIANRVAYNLRVVNLSLAAPVNESYTTDPLCQAAERAVASGLVVVAAAGNYGGRYGFIGAPGNDPAVITVGASDARGTAGRSDDEIASFSSRGPTRFDLGIKPDLVAPGRRVAGPRVVGGYLDTQFPQTRVATGEYLTSAAAPTAVGAYTRLSGTSMAAPAVAGAAAVALQVNPLLPPHGVKLALMCSAQLLSGADPVSGATGLYDPFTQGAGLLNVPGATALASLLLPGGGLASAPPTTSTIAGQTFTWAAPQLSGLIAWTDENGVTTPADTVWGQGLIWEDNDPVRPPVKVIEDDFWGGTLRETDGLIWGQGLIWEDDDPKKVQMHEEDVYWSGSPLSTAGLVLTDDAP